MKKKVRFQLETTAPAKKEKPVKSRHAFTTTHNQNSIFGHSARKAKLLELAKRLVLVAFGGESGFLDDIKKDRELKKMLSTNGKLDQKKVNDYLETYAQQIPREMLKFVKQKAKHFKKEEDLSQVRSTRSHKR